MAVSRNWEGIADPSMGYGEKGPILLGHSKGVFVHKLPKCPKPLRGGGFKGTVSVLLRASLELLGLLKCGIWGSSL